MPFLHLPVQAGSNKVLKEMNRKHDRDYYFELINKFRKARADLAFSSDFIVGFPGETDADFEDTMDLVRRVNYAQCYSFKYSPRPGTPGSIREDMVPEEVKAERLNRLQALIVEQQIAYNQSFVGKTVEVLLDRTGKFENQLIGKTPYMQSVHLTTKLDKFGNMVDVLITGAHQNSLSGEIVESTPTHMAA
jgi:tRNA-2-methylthio-N6-dimethylallyladenosine synthase